MQKHSFKPCNTIANKQNKPFNLPKVNIQLQQVLQQQRLLHAENIEDLRSALQDGYEPCLVCGSTSHPYKLEDTALSKALF